MALTCLQSAVVHVRIPLRVAGTAVVVAVLLNQVDWTDVGAADLVTVGFVALLPLLVLARVRRRFHWLEPVVVLGAVGGAVVAYQGFGLATLAEVSPGIRISRLDTLLIPLWGLAAPVSILAGAALVEIVSTATTWSVATAWDVLGRRVRARRWTTGLLLALVAGRTVQETLRFSDPTALVGVRGLVVAAALTAVTFALCALVTTLADRAGPGEERRRPGPAELVSGWRATAPYLALALAAGIGLQSLLQALLHAVGLTRAGIVVRHAGGATSVLVFASLVAVAALVASLVLAAAPTPGGEPRSGDLRDDVRRPDGPQRREPGDHDRRPAHRRVRRCGGGPGRPGVPPAPRPGAPRSRWPACSRSGSPTRSVTGSTSRSPSSSASPGSARPCWSACSGGCSPTTVTPAATRRASLDPAACCSCWRTPWSVSSSPPCSRCAAGAYALDLRQAESDRRHHRRLPARARASCSPG